MRGTIVKGIAGFYYVKPEEGGEPVQCKARGVFRKDGVKPHVGDHVVFEWEDEELDGFVTEILPRTNQFIRPPIANVDCFIIVCAAAKPAPNFQALDQFLLMAEKEQVEILLVFNKIDKAKPEKLEELRSIYEGLYPTFFVSAVTGEGIEELSERLRGKQSALAGPSGVGKSTMLNAILGQEAMETGQISHKTGRGKHTTRHAELFEMQGEGGGMIFDTPGFTSFEVLEAEEDQLQFLFPEMVPYVNQCRYDNCRHRKEPDCVIREAVEEGKIHPSRYESYLYFLETIQNKKKY